LSGKASFALRDDDSGLIVGEFDEAYRFFIGDGSHYSDFKDDGQEGFRDISFDALGFRANGEFFTQRMTKKGKRQVPGNSWVVVRDSIGAPMGEYYIASAVVDSIKPLGLSAGKVTISGRMLQFPNRAAEGLWNEWASARPATKNLWAMLPLEGREAWLEVAGISQHANPRSILPGPLLKLDGTYAAEPFSFLCAIGEAARGPGGFFGGNLAALEDYSQGFRAAGVNTLVWVNHQVAHPGLDRVFEADELGRSYGDFVLEIMALAGIEVVLA
jgi:hypothetical protein